MPLIKPIPALNDNYIWAIMHPETHKMIVVDPGEAKPVIENLKKKQYQLAAIFITHHHWDHTNGIRDLVDYAGAIPVYGPATSDIPFCNQKLQEGDEIHFPDFDLTVKVIEIPGHTLDHIAFIGKSFIFCGDTLFAGGCGRLFEGNAAQMTASLNRIRDLPKETQIYCAHEYTLKNLQFAKLVEPNNKAIEKRLQNVEKLRRDNKPTLPSVLQLELATNPFLRYDKDSIRKSVETHSGKSLPNPISVFTELRQWKNEF